MFDVLAALLEKLNPVHSARYEARNSGAGCLAGTRESVFDKAAEWFQSGAPDAPFIFWLFGLGGTGKTTISHSVCQDLEAKGNPVASYFFSRSVAERRRLSSIIPTIAYQLALHPELRGPILDAFKSHPDAPFLSMHFQIKFLLVEPLERVKKAPINPILIVLDALDECDKDQGKEGGDLIPLLAQHIPLLPAKIRLFVTSRPEPSIRTMFGVDAVHRFSDTVILHNIEESIVQKDISAYLSDQLGNLARARHWDDDWPTSSDIQQLVYQCGSFFIVASTFVKYIGSYHHSPRKQLRVIIDREKTSDTSIYRDVDGLYRHILVNFLACADEDCHYLADRFRRVVGTIILLQAPLSLRSLARLLVMDLEDVESTVQPLASVLDVPSSAITSDATIKIFHPSFPDFLLDMGRCRDDRLAIDGPRHHGQIAMHCLQTMLAYLRRDPCSIEAQIGFAAENIPALVAAHVAPELAYACLYWATHLSLSSQDLKDLFSRELREFCSSKLLLWIEHLSLLGRLSDGLTDLGLVVTWCQV